GFFSGPGTSTSASTLAHNCNFVPNEFRKIFNCQNLLLVNKRESGPNLHKIAINNCHNGSLVYFHKIKSFKSLKNLEAKRSMRQNLQTVSLITITVHSAYRVNLFHRIAI